MRLSTKYNDLLMYGLSMGLVLVVLKWLETQFMLSNSNHDLLIGGIAVLFTALGVWLAFKLMMPKVEIRIVEKEVYRDVPSPQETDPNEIEKLGISKRELEVLQLMAKGLSNEEIAGKLFVSLNTIKTHSSNIYIKLDVKRRTQAIEKAKRLTIIT